MHFYRRIWKILNFSASVTRSLDPLIVPVLNGWYQAINILEDNDDWRTIAGPTPSLNTGPEVDHTMKSASGKYLYTESSGPVAGYENRIFSPCIYLDTFSDPVLNFWYHMHGDSMGILNVAISSDAGSTWSTIWTKSGPVQNAITDAWEKASVGLTSYINKSIMLRFEGVIGPSYTSDMSIDDVYVGPASGCKMLEINRFISVSGYWNNPLNWSKGRVPTICDQVIIRSGRTAIIDQGTAAKCYTLDVKPGGKLTEILGSILEVKLTY